MSTPQNNQLFVLRHKESQNYVCFDWSASDFYLYPELRDAFFFDKPDDSITEDVLNSNYWDKKHLPSALEFELVELSTTPISITVIKSSEKQEHHNDLKFEVVELLMAPTRISYANDK